MSTNSGPLTEVLHSDKHTKLTAERRVSTILRHSFEEFSEYRRLSLLVC